EVVRRKVPDDADIVLKEPEIDPRRIVIIEAAQYSVVDELADFSHRPGEEEGVVDHDLQILPLGQLDQLLGLLDGGGERLLDENVLTVLEGGLCQLEMGGH